MRASLGAACGALPIGEREASVHPEHAPQQNKATSVRESIVDNREPRDARDNINEHR
jgi:hypothetical protein